MSTKSFAVAEPDPSRFMVPTSVQAARIEPKLTTLAMLASWTEQPRACKVAMAEDLPLDYHMLMSRVQTIVQLSTELIEKLDDYCAKTGISRSAAIREALKHWFGSVEDAEIGRRIAEGYRKFPQELDEDWRDLAAVSHRDTLAMMNDLEREEREAGLEPMRPEP